MKVFNRVATIFLLGAAFTVDCGRKTDSVSPKEKAAPYSPAGVYAFEGTGVDRGFNSRIRITYTLDLRSDNSALISVELDQEPRSPIKKGKGDIRPGKTSWKLQDGKVVVSGRTFTIEGNDLIHEDGVRYVKVR
jgi:hypothetical protein